MTMIKDIDEELAHFKFFSLSIANFDNSGFTLRDVLTVMEHTTKMITSKFQINLPVELRKEGLVLLLVDGKKPDLENISKKLLNELFNLNPLLTEEGKVVLQNGFLAGEDDDFENIYFYPFTLSRCWLYIFMLYYFSTPNELHEYWMTYPDRRQFIVDVCYFIGVCCDPSVMYAVSEENIDAFWTVCKKLQDECETQQVVEERLNYIEKQWDRSGGNKTNNAKQEDKDFEEDEEGEDDIYRKFYASFKTENNNEHTDEYMSSFNEMDFHIKKMEVFHEAVLEMAISIPEHKMTHEDALDKIGKDTCFDAFVFIETAILSLSRHPFYPAEVARESGVNLLKIHNAILMIPHLLYTKNKLFFKLCNRYEAVTLGYPRLKPWSFFRMCIILHFFTETHLDMLYNDVENIIRQTYQVDLLNGENKDLI